jgi:hypothetical protein
MGAFPDMAGDFAHDLRAFVDLLHLTKEVKGCD